MGRILFVDDHDCDRGPMARAIAMDLGMDAESVGTMPAPHVTMAAEQAMAEIGLHVEAHRPRGIDMHHMYDEFDRVIALGSGLAETCPDLHVQESWAIPRPGPHSLHEAIQVRDLLALRIRELARVQQGAT